jgi:ATP-dependent Clp protease ATP-binding subunit ClpA
MFERFTPRARQVVVLAEDEARRLKHNYIGTEHLLLGLIREEEGIAARVLESLDVTVEEVRSQVSRIVGHGDELASGPIPFTPRVQKILDLALREALSLGHNYIGTEHLLLGLASEGEGVAIRILLDFDADPRKIRDEIIRIMSGPGRQPNEPSLPPEDATELERARLEKEEAVEAQEFERAAELGGRERNILLAARGIEPTWSGFPEVSQSMFPTSVRRGDMLLGGLLFAAGLFAGWLIWG